jgi:hypothetical protein
MLGAHFDSGWKMHPGLAALLMFSITSAPAWSADAATAQVTASATENAAPAQSQPVGHVARAIFTTAIADREPVDQIETLSTSVDRVFFFTDLRELGGQIVTHRWEFAGKVMAEVTFKVGNGTRWRVYSSKNLLPDWTGTWTVVVSNQDGQPLQTSTFEYTAEE